MLGVGSGKTTPADRGDVLFCKHERRPIAASVLIAKGVYAEFMPRAVLFTARLSLVGPSLIEQPKAAAKSRHEGTDMILLDVAVAAMATVATTVLLVWAKRKRQAVPSSKRSDAVDTMLALGFVVLFMVSVSALTVAMMPAFGDGPTALIASGSLYVTIVAVTLYAIGRSNSIDSLASRPST
jgi:hypothetical protein